MLAGVTSKNMHLVNEWLHISLSVWLCVCVLWHTYSWSVEWLKKWWDSYAFKFYNINFRSLLLISRNLWEICFKVFHISSHLSLWILLCRRPRSYIRCYLNLSFPAHCSAAWKAILVTNSSLTLLCESWHKAEKRLFVICSLLSVSC